MTHSILHEHEYGRRTLFVSVSILTHSNFYFWELGCLAISRSRLAFIHSCARPQAGNSQEYEKWKVKREKGTFVCLQAGKIQICRNMYIPTPIYPTKCSLARPCFNGLCCVCPCKVCKLLITDCWHFQAWKQCIYVVCWAEPQCFLALYFNVFHKETLTTWSLHARFDGGGGGEEKVLRP
jgi:hypothetical protein